MQSQIPLKGMQNRPHISYCDENNMSIDEMQSLIPALTFHHQDVVDDCTREVGSGARLHARCKQHNNHSTTAPPFQSLADRRHST
ncbi:hypothetical protein KIN20_016933 [Parelaphostrongylus tenuis]|uniref:Uncharacterized protein n=1 Tax=Parelaphostrongylus tenuis TaxID=148309 RepID=A0AAD5QR43_PARTN|nr:hypothetical protein KIN20_016933 [Parelaphostrongylus tenuis]